MAFNFSFSRKATKQSSRPRHLDKEEVKRGEGGEEMLWWVGQIHCQ